MSGAAALIALVVQGAMFELTSIAFEDPETFSFLADVDGVGDAELCVLDGGTVSAYHVDSGRVCATVAFEEGTLAFDIADVDEDGRPEVIAIWGGRVMRYPIGADGQARGPRELFTLGAPWPAESSRPYTHAMAIKHEGETLLALPSGNAFTLRRLDGSVAAAYPVRPPARDKGDGEGWSVWPWPALRTGSSTGFACLLRGHDLEPKPGLPPELAVSRDETWRHGSIRRACRAAEEEADSWPWFPLKTEGDDAGRALYALGEQTRIRVKRGGDASSSGAGAKAGPEQAYPGMIVLPRSRNELPDFDGDGYVDLVVWTAPQPGMSVDSLTRTVLGRDWPIRVSAYLFSPEENRFEPRPAGVVRFRVPVATLLAGLFDTPLDRCAFGDFDGDGKTDCGIGTEDDSFSIWLYHDGFPKEPTETHRFPEPITEVSAPGAGAIILRSEHFVNLLHAGASR